MGGKLPLRLLVAVAMTATVATLAVIERRATQPAPAPPPTTAAGIAFDAHAVAIVGDSLSVQASDAERTQLETAGWQRVLADAQVCRRITAESTLPPTSGISAVRALRGAGIEPVTWVVQLGTNDVAPIGDDERALRREIDTMLAEIGPGRRIVWVNVYHAWQPVASATFNRLLDEIASRRPDMVVADWASRATFDDYVGRDGVHLTQAGTIAFAELIVDATARVEHVLPASFTRLDAVALRGRPASPASPPNTSGNEVTQPPASCLATVQAGR